MNIILNTNKKLKRLKHITKRYNFHDTRSRIKKIKNVDFLVFYTNSRIPGLNKN